MAKEKEKATDLQIADDKKEKKTKKFVNVPVF